MTWRAAPATLMVMTTKSLLLTEFGATRDVATLEEHLQQFDSHMIPWMYWSYSEPTSEGMWLPSVSPAPAKTHDFWSATTPSTLTGLHS